MRNTFVRVGTVANDVVVNLASRRKPHVPFKVLGEMMRSSVSDLDQKAAQKAETEQHVRDFIAEKENAHPEVRRGRALITKGIHCIRDNSSPDDAIKYLEDTLAAIRGA